MIKLTGLWEHKNQKGETYYTGNLGRGRIVILSNSFADKPNDPKFHMFIAEDNATKQKVVQEDDVPQ